MWLILREWTRTGPEPYPASQQAASLCAFPTPKPLVLGGGEWLMLSRGILVSHWRWQLRDLDVMWFFFAVDGMQKVTVLDTDYKHYVVFCVEVPKDDQKYNMCQYMCEYGRQEAWRRVRGAVSPDNQQGGGMGQQFIRPSSTKGMSCHVMAAKSGQCCYAGSPELPAPPPQFD